MARQDGFKSLDTTLAEIQATKGIESDAAAHLLSFAIGAWRDQQEVLHFETAQAILGPGRVIGVDAPARAVHIQLLGEAMVRTYSFAEIGDFGPAQYNNPETMGQTLLGAYWEAKTTRRYLERIVANSYARLAPEEIESFSRIAEVAPNDVSHLLPLEMPESEIKSHFCQLVGNPFVQKDWGGEACDIFCSLNFRRRSVPAAFVLKGKAYAHRPLRIADLGKNGDQLVRMFSLQAEVFVVQTNGPVDGTVYSHVQAQIAEKLMTAQPVYYLILDGVQTARLLRAYGII